MLRGFAAISARVSRERGVSSGGMSAGFWKLRVAIARTAPPPAVSHKYHRAYLFARARARARMAG